MDLDAVPAAVLSSKNRAHLKRAGFTSTHEVLCCPTNALQRRTGLTSDEVEACVAAVSRHRMPACMTVAEALQQEAMPRLSIGAGHAFDDLVGGALRTGSVTEVVGESATGKSNFCMQLAIQAQLPVELGGLAASALYLSSETSQSAFPSNRLVEIARAVRQRHEDHPGLPREQELLAHVQLGNCKTLEALDLILSHHAPKLNIERLARGQSRLGLIVVDSLAAPSRSDFATNTLSGLNDRAKALSLMGDMLKRLAHELRLAVIVVNQVSDVFTRHHTSSTARGSDPSSEAGLAPPTTFSPHEDDDELFLPYDAQARFFDGQAPNVHKQAALGIVWANAIDTRIMLSLTQRHHRPEQRSGMEGKQSIRRATLVYSPFAPPASVDYVIDAEGVRAVSEVYNVGERWPVRAIEKEEAAMRAAEEEEALWASVKLNSDLEYELDGQVP